MFMCLKASAWLLLACVVVLTCHGRQAAAATSNFDPDPGQQAASNVARAYERQQLQPELEDSLATPNRIRLKVDPDGDFRRRPLSDKENALRQRIDQLLEQLSGSIPPTRSMVSQLHVPQPLQHPQVERPIIRNGRTFPSGQQALSSSYEPRMLANGNVQRQPAPYSLQESTAMIDGRTGSKNLLGLVWNPDGSQVKKQRFSASANVTPYYSSAEELAAAGGGQAPRQLGLKGSGALFQPPPPPQQQQQHHSSNSYSQLEDDLSLPVRLQHQHQHQQQPQPQEHNLEIIDVVNGLHGSVPPARHEGGYGIQPAASRHRQRSGTEEVALQMPLHSQSSADFEFKRVENSRGWNNLRGMWGKRSAISARVEQQEGLKGY